MRPRSCVKVATFTEGCGFVAHNSSFDRGFWLHELDRADASPRIAPEFACTVKLARRLYPDSPNCKLGTLARFHRLPDNGRAHRALADALTTAQLVQRMQRDIGIELAEFLGELSVEHELLLRLQAVARPHWDKAPPVLPATSGVICRFHWFEVRLSLAWWRDMARCAPAAIKISKTFAVKVPVWSH